MTSTGNENGISVRVSHGTEGRSGSGRGSGVRHPVDRSEEDRGLVRYEGAVDPGTSLTPSGRRTGRDGVRWVSGAKRSCRTSSVKFSVTKNLFRREQGPTSIYGDYAGEKYRVVRSSTVTGTKHLT